LCNACLAARHVWLPAYYLYPNRKCSFNLISTQN
jgi:hypothetical protein